MSATRSVLQYTSDLIISVNQEKDHAKKIDLVATFILQQLRVKNPEAALADILYIERNYWQFSTYVTDLEKLKDNPELLATAVLLNLDDIRKHFLNNNYNKQKIVSAALEARSKNLITEKACVSYIEIYSHCYSYSHSQKDADIINAIICNSYEILKALAKEDYKNKFFPNGSIQVNKKQFTLLEYAAHINSYEAIKYVLSQKIEINDSSKYPICNALEIALEQGSIDSLKLLLKNKASYDQATLMKINYISPTDETNSFTRTFRFLETHLQLKQYLMSKSSEDFKILLTTFNKIINQKDKNDFYEILKIHGIGFEIESRYSTSRIHSTLGVPTKEILNEQETKYEEKTKATPTSTQLQLAEKHYLQHGFEALNLYSQNPLFWKNNPDLALKLHEHVLRESALLEEAQEPHKRRTLQ